MQSYFGPNWTIRPLLGALLVALPSRHRTQTKGQRQNHQRNTNQNGKSILRNTKTFHRHYFALVVDHMRTLEWSFFYGKYLIFVFTRVVFILLYTLT